jgi:hypothetical protein
MRECKTACEIQNSATELVRQNDRFPKLNREGML